VVSTPSVLEVRAAVERLAAARGAPGYIDTEALRAALGKSGGLWGAVEAALPHRFQLDGRTVEATFSPARTYKRATVDLTIRYDDGGPSDVEDK
jgi:hypothetical protein